MPRTRLPSRTTSQTGLLHGERLAVLLCIRCLSKVTTHLKATLKDSITISVGKRREYEEVPFDPRW